MKVLIVPGRLRMFALLLLSSVLWIALEVALQARAPWWKLPFLAMAYWSIAVSLIFIPFVIWILNGKKWALNLFGLFSLGWIFASVFLTFQSKNPSLGFFTIFLIAFLFFEWVGLKRELQKSFFDPQVYWYQSLPLAIRGLNCRAAILEQSLQFRVSRMDTEGAFVFVSSQTTPASLEGFYKKAGKGLPFIFQFKNRQMKCQARSIFTIEQGKGVGIQFIQMTADQKKDLGDFVEILRGEGQL